MKTLTAKSKQAAAFTEAERSAKPTSFTGAWTQVQLGLTNVVVQSQADLVAGRVDAAKIRSLLDAEQEKLQKALDRQSRLGLRNSPLAIRTSQWVIQQEQQRQK